jgi:glycogen(starch) synthase
VLEAALSGCSLVLGDIPSLRGLWDGAALFVPPNDPAALKTALRHLMARPAWREELGHAARARGLEFTPERMASGYLSAYSELMMAKTPHELETTRAMS